MYIAFVIAVVVAHLAFVAYLAVGGFVALRWRWTIACHVLTAAWAVLIVTHYVDCPLTWLERWGRARAGMAPLPPAGFIAHYLTGVVYPTGWAGGVEAAAFVIVVVSWIAFAWRMRRGPAVLRERDGKEAAVISATQLHGR